MTLRYLVLTGITLGMGFFAPPAQAAKVKVWQHTQASHFDKAQFQGAVISSEGLVRLSRLVKPFADVSASHVWALAEDKAGNLYAATGGDGKLFKISADGKAEVVYSSKDSQVLSLAATPDGAVFAGTGPGGTVVRLGPGEKPKIVAEKLGTYVWSLVHDKGTLFAGTGPKGQIYQLPAAGKADVYYTTKQDHILALASDGKGRLYAGTDKGGLVYRIDGPDKGFVLHQASQGDVRGLAVAGDVVFAGTSAPVVRRFTSAGAGPDGKGAGPASSGSGDNALFRIAPDGAVRELFRDKSMVLSLLPQQGKVLVGTGMSGQLFEVDAKSKERTEIARLDQGQILCLRPWRDGAVLLGTGDPGKIYVVENRFAAKGTVVSEVLDAKLISRWGALTWKAGAPSGTAVTVATRSGNVAEPDATWSNWSAEQEDPRESKVLSPAARFLQHRITLTSTSPAATPELRHIALRYQTANQAPEITSLDVPDVDAVNLDNPRKFKIRWTAADVNEDDLTYTLHFRKLGWKEWVQLEEELEKKEFDWDTTTIPSGLYQIKVTASDRKDNPPEDALAAQRISAAVPIANTPPAVTLKLTGFDAGQALFEGRAVDPLVRLTEAAFAVNGNKWTGIFPVDRLFDSKAEDFRFKTEPLRPGTHVVVLRVRDAAGNAASADVVFTVPK